MREGWARSTWGRVQPLSGTFCCSRVQPRAAACRDHMHGSCLSIEFECSHVLLYAERVAAGGYVILFTMAMRWRAV